jgi:hypothetical protein
MKLELNTLIAIIEGKQIAYQELIEVYKHDTSADNIAWLKRIESKLEVIDELLIEVTKREG